MSRTKKTTRSITSRDIGYNEELESYMVNTSKHDDLNINNHLNTLHLSIISIFSVNNRHEQEKYIVVRNAIDHKFVIKMSDQRHYVSFNEHNNVYQYERHRGNFLNEGQDIDNLDRVLYVCGNNGLCIKDRNDEGPFTVNFVSKNNVSKETLMIEGAVIAYPLINVSELMTYNHENYHLLYEKIFAQTCVIRSNFIHNNLCHLKSLRCKLVAINNKFEEIKSHIQCLEAMMDQNCERNKNTCMRLVHTKYDRFCQVIKEANPEIELLKSINGKVESYFSYILDFARMNDDFALVHDKLAHIEECIAKLK